MASAARLAASSVLAEMAIIDKPKLLISPGELKVAALTMREI